MNLPSVHADHLRLGFRSGSCRSCCPPSWHDDARHNALRPAAVGGVPLDDFPHAARPDRPPDGSGRVRGAVAPRAA